MNQIVALTAEIGRGHPQYLDSVLAHLPAVKKLVVSGTGWRLARQVYHLGAQGGLLTTVYQQFREKATPSHLELRLWGSKLRKQFWQFPGIVLVDHPLLARLLAPVCRVAYLHCEIAAPEIAAVKDAWQIYVPVEFTAHQLQTRGVKPDALSITGLVIEPELLPVARSAYESRLQRYESDKPLTIAFFTSGAYPRPHLRTIAIAAASASYAGHKTIIFAGTDKTKGKLLPSALFFNSRKAENEQTAKLFPEIDVFVAAAHERTNWAIGLGLPLFVLLPNIGPFAEQNFNFARQQGTTLPLNDAQNFGPLLDTLRQQGKLQQMAQSGWGKHRLNGARFIADHLLSQNYHPPQF